MVLTIVDHLLGAFRAAPKTSVSSWDRVPLGATCVSAPLHPVRHCVGQGCGSRSQGSLLWLSSTVQRPDGANESGPGEHPPFCSCILLPWALSCPGWSTGSPPFWQSRGFSPSCKATRRQRCHQSGPTYAIADGRCVPLSFTPLSVLNCRLTSAEFPNPRYCPWQRSCASDTPSVHPTFYVARVRPGEFLSLGTSSCNIKKKNQCEI